VLYTNLVERVGRKKLTLGLSASIPNNITGAPLSPGLAPS
jgi:hypothetical protein